ncbi:MAG TPA: TatD family hydrolase [Chitinophagaceae bacterium]|nr:TatD family hydrolase [Chitinophagaceae bacterium]
MTLIDTHSHIYLPEFDMDRGPMLERAGGEGISKILMPAIDSSTHDAMLKLEKDDPATCLSMMGLHPCSVKENPEDELKIARDHLEKRSFIAVGETGLDFYWDKTFIQQQYMAFHQQIEWALHYDIPVVIHSRNSIDECIKVVEEQQNGKLKGVFHCFSGNLEQAAKIIDLGFYMGIGGVLTFKNSGLDVVMGNLNLDHVVLETDAPYLAPTPFRGKRNEPAYLKYVLEKLATIKNASREEIASITTANAEKLFGKL